MSDGMSDGVAWGRLVTRLRSAALVMRRAIDETQEGHRGLCPDIESEVNVLLIPAGWKLVRVEEPPRASGEDAEVA
jgi:hypothetical protein